MCSLRRSCIPCICPPLRHLIAMRHFQKLLRLILLRWSLPDFVAHIYRYPSVYRVAYLMTVRPITFAPFPRLPVDIRLFRFRFRPCGGTTPVTNPTLRNLLWGTGAARENSREGRWCNVGFGWRELASHSSATHGSSAECTVPLRTTAMVKWIFITLESFARVGEGRG